MVESNNFVDDSQNIEDAKIEKCVMGVIHKIKNSRSRPCFQNILTLVNRGGKNLTIEHLKEIIKSMINKNMISDKGKEGCESFFILKEHDILMDEEGADDLLPTKKDDKLEADTNIMVEDGSDERKLFSYIDESFEQILNSRIITHVKQELESIMNEKSFLRTNAQQSSDEKHNYSNNHHIITNLQSEINFLRSELLNKNKIIEMLLINNNGEKSSGNNPLHLNRDENLRMKHHSQANSNKFELKNSFSLLGNERINDKKIITTIASQPTCNNTVDLTDDINADYVNQDENFERKKRNSRNITILGDSLLKDIKPYKMRQAMYSKDKVYIKSFPGATTECMRDYVTPSLKFNPDLLIIHTGTNDLRSDKTPTDIVEEIINLVERIKTNDNDVIVSGLLVRDDNLNDKRLQVNALLKLKCVKINVHFLENDNIYSSQHLNASGLHLNPKGTIELANNFLKCIYL